MKALITGGNGFIGSHLAELLLRRSVEVRCLVRRTSDVRWLKNLPVEYCYGDLFDETALRQAVHGVEYIYHSAGTTKAQRKEEYYRGNATGTRNLLRAAAEESSSLLRFLHVSSQAAAGPSPTRTPINEEVPPHPITTYGRSKLESEKECHALAERLPITIVRPPAVYGPREKDIFEFFRTMSRGLQPMIGLREKFVSLVHVSDLVRGMVLAAESPAASGQTYFLSSREAYSWKEIGEITRHIMGTRVIPVRVPEFIVFLVSAVAEMLSRLSTKPALLNIEKGRDIVQQYWTCDSSKAYRDFGYREEMSLEDGIRETVAWYRTEGWLSPRRG